MNEEVKKMAQLKPGDIAPQFKLDDQNGKKAKLSDYQGRKLLVYFYPQANTPVCTAQACSVRDAKGDFSSLGVAAVGIVVGFCGVLNAGPDGDGDDTAGGGG